MPHQCCYLRCVTSERQLTSHCFLKTIFECLSEGRKNIVKNTQFARLMPNVGGPRENRRRLLASVVHSVLLYGAPSWAHTLDLVPGNVKLMNKTHCKVLLRCICAYRMTLEVTSNVIRSTQPSDLPPENVKQSS